MSGCQQLDSLVKTRLRGWPQRPPGIGRRAGGHESWFRGRPGEVFHQQHPYLKLPGSGPFRTIPDGLWLNFGGTPVEPYVDIFAIEACGSLPNLLDKRFRFAPSTQSLLAVCPMPWLLAPSPENPKRARWETILQLQFKPHTAFVAPVRDVRVLYGLKWQHYRQMAHGLVPHPHEYFVPMDALTAENGDRSPALQALMSRACAMANFLGPEDDAPVAAAPP